MGGTAEIERDPQEESAPPLDRALDLLEEAERPVLFLGVEALRAGIGQQVRRLAERLSAPVLTTPQAKGIIPEDHPLVFGNAVRKGVVRDMIQHADLALAIGTRLREVDVKRRGLVLPRLIHVDWDAQWLDRNFKTELSLMGPIPKIVEGLLQGLGPPSAPGKGRGEVEKMRARLHEEVSKARKKRVELEYLEVIRQALPSSGIHVVDNTQLGYWAEYFYVSLCPGGLLGAKGSSTIGFAFAAAMGAKLACPETAVISTMGDGGFLYSAQELATCVRHHIGFPLIVVNDGAYGVIAYLQRTAFEKEYESRLTNPDFCKLAQAYGVPAVRVDSPGALGEALDRALNDGRMWLVELMADFPEPPFGLY
jgi:acetolactate synthase-1/2/3 large subunit